MNYSVSISRATTENILTNFLHLIVRTLRLNFRGKTFVNDVNHNSVNDVYTSRWPSRDITSPTQKGEENFLNSFCEYSGRSKVFSAPVSPFFPALLSVTHAHGTVYWSYLPAFYSLKRRCQACITRLSTGRSHLNPS